MDKCPKCGSELRQGLSFCPKCGELIGEKTRQEANGAHIKSMKQKKKLKVWQIILLILFLPFGITYIVAKTQKLKKGVKIVIIVVFWILLIAIGTVNNQNNSIGQTSNSEIDNTKLKENQEETDITQTDTEEDVYHGDKWINKLLNDYNKIAEIEITPDMVSDGAYNFNCNITCNDVFIQIYDDSTNGIIIEYQLEADDDSKLVPLFRDFAIALKSDIDTNTIDTAITELRTEKYQNYTKYDMNGLQCGYSVQKLAEGQGNANRYRVDLQSKEYNK